MTRIEAISIGADEAGGAERLLILGLCEIAIQLDRIAVQLEKITSLKYTEDA